MKAQRKRLALAILAAGVLISLGLAVAITRRMPPDQPARYVYPWATPSPAGWVPGIVVVRADQDYTLVTPRPNQVAAHFSIDGDVYDLAALDSKIAAAATRGLKSWIGINLFTNIAGSTPDVPHVPAGAATVTYATGCGYNEYAPRYTSLATPYANLVSTVTARYNNNSNVAGYVFGPGVAEEMINAYQFTAAGDCSTKRTSLEATTGSSCLNFVDWTRAGAVIWAERTDKPVTVATGGGGACVASWANTWEENGYQTWGRFFPVTPMFGTTPTPTPIYGLIYRGNGLGIQSDNWTYGANASFGRFQAGILHAERGGAAYEFGSNTWPRPSDCTGGFACSIPTPQRIGYTSDVAWLAMYGGAVNLFWQCDPYWHPTYGCWLDWLSADAQEAIDKTMGRGYGDSPAAWVRFGDNVYPTYFNRSDVPGPYTFLAAVTATPVAQYCEPVIRGTAQAAPGTPESPNVCGSVINNSGPESRNALGYAAGSALKIDLDDRWASNGVFTGKLIYHDWPDDTITVAWKNGATTETHTITKGYIDGWATAEFTMTLTLDGFTTHDIEIQTDSGEDILYLFWVETGESIATPTPTATSTPLATSTPTPTATWTPTPTATSTSTATATATATSIPASGVIFTEVSPTTGADWNLDGAITAADRWFELYNTTGSAKDLTGYRITNGTASAPLLGRGHVLAAGDRRIYFAEGLIVIPDAGTLTLVSSTGVTISSVTYPAQSTGACYAWNGAWSSGQTCTPGS